MRELMRGFLMKDLAAVEEAVDIGAKIYDGTSPFQFSQKFIF
jgi:hypothetical protein